ncbi:DMP19 family protein [Chitinophaga varians]|uniref:DMP19 family protein n=1 Tax=Chitinophaga varians TaxID=2202339 RepID=UPI00165F386B|nr:DUF4375 domain-containing protein [Chitinophaga varians]MBC9914082.1 DUF4375 domain-containing protein [Chitinophaga varians]
MTEYIPIQYTEQVSKAFELAVGGLTEEWFQLQDDSWYQYVTALPLQLRVVYLIEVLDAQVFNGGFHQYFSNRYGMFALSTIDALRTIGAAEKSSLLEKAYTLVNPEFEPDVFRQKLVRGEIEMLRDKTVVAR